jgi:type II secretory pathway pseudopilin PulG
MVEIMKMRTHLGHPKPRTRRERKEAGLTLIELMIAAFVLAVGLAGMAILFTTAAIAVQRTKLDTNSTLVAKLIMEQIAAQDPSKTGTDSQVIVNDCSGTAWTVYTAGGSSTASPPGAGATLATSSSSTFYGGIDFTQNYSDVPTGYKMQYKDCGGANANGGFTTYDVRWNIITTGTDTSGNATTRMVTVGAHQLGVSSNNLGRLFFAFPANLRSLEGPIQ